MIQCRHGLQIRTDTKAGKEWILMIGFVVLLVCAPCRAVLVRLQVTMESGGLRRSRHAQHPVGEHMAARYRPL